MSNGSALEINDAAVQLGGDSGFHLRAPDITLGAGEAMACVGPSGSGKTTLVRMASGLLRPDSGSVITLGQHLTSLDDGAIRSWRVRRVGLVFQDFALLAHLTALENILLPFYIGSGMRLTRDARQRAHELAAHLEVDHTLARRPNRLSHGERQRIAVCRALVTRPMLLLCDEPTASLDEDRASLVLSLMDRERMERNAAVVVTTHDHRVAERIGRVLDLTPEKAAVA